MTRFLAILFGIYFIFLGVVGFLPNFNQGNLLFGYFSISVFHNLFYVVTGVLAIMSATDYRAAKIFFKLFGIVFVIMGIVGYFRQDLYFAHVNTADNLLHLISGAIALVIGFRPSGSR